VTRHHAHTSDHLVMALGAVVVIACAAICWAGLDRLLGGAA
jgi:hypothetical protein